jgi:hypothetical protein
VRGLLLGLLLLSLGLAGGLALLASEKPDGLEYTLGQVGSKEGSAAISSPMPGYEAPLSIPVVWRRVIAGMSGTLICAGLVWLVGWAMRRRRREG